MDIDDVSMEEDKDAAFLFFQNDQISNVCCTCPSCFL